MWDGQLGGEKGSLPLDWTRPLLSLLEPFPGQIATLCETGLLAGFLFEKQRGRKFGKKVLELQFFL